MPTVREIARQAGVSAATVSRVLNSSPKVSPSIRQRVLQVAAIEHNGLNGHVGLAPTRHSRAAGSTLALMYTGDASVGSPFDATLLAGMSMAIEEAGHDLLMLNPRTSKMQGESYTDMFHRKGVAAAIVRTNVRTKRVCREIAREGFPMVVVGERFDDADASDQRVNYVYSDSRGTSREAVSHLIEQGHRRVAVVINVIDDSDHLDRLEGWREAHRDHGIEPDEKLILRTPALRDGGVQAMKRIAAMSDMPTAVFITDPFSAIGAMNQALAMGIDIPNQLSVVGFDDAEYRHSVYPAMTAVCQNTFELGREAVMFLLQMMRNSPRYQPGGRCLPSWFEIHDSTSLSQPVGVGRPGPNASMSA